MEEQVQTMIDNSTHDDDNGKDGGSDHIMIKGMLKTQTNHQMQPFLQKVISSYESR
jgi:hypothetical protein